MFIYVPGRSYNQAATPRIPAIAAPTPIMAAVGCEPTPPVAAAWVAEEAAESAPAARLEALVAKLDAPAATDEAAPWASETKFPAADEAAPAAPDAPVSTAVTALPNAAEADPATPDAPVSIAVKALPTALPRASLTADTAPETSLEETNAWTELTNAGSVGKEMEAVARSEKTDATPGSEIADPILAISEVAASAIELRPEGTRSLA